MGQGLNFSPSNKESLHQLAIRKRNRTCSTSTQHTVRNALPGRTPSRVTKKCGKSFISRNQNVTGILWYGTAALFRAIRIQKRTARRRI